MTPDEAYNIGFLAGCAEAGLNGTEATALHAKTAATKQALGGLGTLAGAVGGLTGPAPWDDKQEKHADMNDLLHSGLFSALATGTVVGGGIGAGLGVMARPDPLKNDNAPLVRNLQQAELVAALRQHASRARQTATVLRAKAETPPPRSVFGI